MRESWGEAGGGGISRRPPLSAPVCKAPAGTPPPEPEQPELAPSDSRRLLKSPTRGVTHCNPEMPKTSSNTERNGDSREAGGGDEGKGRAAETQRGRQEAEITASEARPAGSQSARLGQALAQPGPELGARGRGPARLGATAQCCPSGSGTAVGRYKQEAMAVPEGNRTAVAPEQALLLPRTWELSAGTCIGTSARHLPSQKQPSLVQAPSH